VFGGPEGGVVLVGVVVGVHDVGPEKTKNNGVTKIDDNKFTFFI
jgi:hypothetical protein